MVHGLSQSMIPVDVFDVIVNRAPPVLEHDNATPLTVGCVIVTAGVSLGSPEYGVNAEVPSAPIEKAEEPPGFSAKGPNATVGGAVKLHAVARPAELLIGDRAIDVPLTVYVDRPYSH
jgi:hypothetical protein